MTGKQKFFDWVDDHLGIVALVVSGTALCGVVGGTVALINRSDHIDCGKYERSSGYTTEWAYYGFWNHECFVVMPDGTRIPVDKMFNNVGN